MHPEHAMKTTDQQNDAIAKFNTCKPTKISAFAGCGKTSTLIAISKQTRRKGSFMSFNKAIANDAAQKFGPNVTCRTTHALAFRDTIRDFDGNADKLTGALNGGVIAAKLGLSELLGSKNTRISARSRGALVASALANFHNSDDAEPSAKHVVLSGKLAELPAATKASISRIIAKSVTKAWEMSIDKKSTMPLGHGGYLKHWALSSPALWGDFVMLDEAQDTAPVVLGIVKKQRAQVVCVGDRHQSIYGWRGATNAMELLPATHEAKLTKSWRFGPEIAANATRVLRMLGETERMEGNPDRKDFADEGYGDGAECVLFRTNGMLISHVVGELQAGRKPFIIGGSTDMLAMIRATELLMAGVSVDAPLDFFGFANWNEVVEASIEEGGEDLARWVRMVSDNGIAELKKAVHALAMRREHATHSVTTGHKSKGLEWETVHVSSDFMPNVSTNSNKAPSSISGHIISELQLLYVAVTRGKSVVTMSPELMSKIGILEHVHQRTGASKKVLEPA